MTLTQIKVSIREKPRETLDEEIDRKQREDQQRQAMRRRGIMYWNDDAEFVWPPRRMR